MPDTTQPDMQANEQKHKTLWGLKVCPLLLAQVPPSQATHSLRRTLHFSAQSSLQLVASHEPP